MSTLGYIGIGVGAIVGLMVISRIMQPEPVQFAPQGGMAQSQTTTWQDIGGFVGGLIGGIGAASRAAGTQQEARQTAPTNRTDNTGNPATPAGGPWMTGLGGLFGRTPASRGTA